MTDETTPEAPEVAVEAVAAEDVPQAPPEPEAAEPVRDEAAEAAIQAASGEALARWAARAALDEAGPGISLGEQPHDPGCCDRGGQPHLGPCVEPEPVAEAPEPAPEGEAVLAAHPEWVYLFTPPVPAAPEPAPAETPADPDAHPWAWSRIFSEFAMMAADIRQGYVTDRDLVESWYQVAYSRYYGVPLAAALPPVSPEPAAEERTPAVSGAPAIGSDVA